MNQKGWISLPEMQAFLSALVFAATVIQLYGAPHPLPLNWLLTEPHLFIIPLLLEVIKLHIVSVFTERCPLLGLCCFSVMHHSLFCKELSLVASPEKLNYCK